jgi:hypothetical protein
MPSNIMISISAALVTFRLQSVVWGQGPPLPPEVARAKIVMLGTFHFDDQGLDGYKPKHRLDLLSAQRQKEVGELLSALARFRPNKIAVEYRVEGQAGLDSEYAKYLAAKEDGLGPNEIYQLGFRLARRLGHSKPCR